MTAAEFAGGQGLRQKLGIPFLMQSTFLRVSIWEIMAILNWPLFARLTARFGWQPGLVAKMSNEQQLALLRDLPEHLYLVQRDRRRARLPRYSQRYSLCSCYRNPALKNPEVARDSYT